MLTCAGSSERERYVVEHMLIDWEMFNELLVIRGMKKKKTSKISEKPSESKWMMFLGCSPGEDLVGPHND